LSWDALEVHEWVQYFINENVARILLRHKIDGAGLLRLNVNLCGELGFTMDEAVQLLRTIEKYSMRQSGII
jgi:hypothetical protein